jgi:hypothetical protein
MSGRKEVQHLRGVALLDNDISPLIFTPLNRIMLYENS